MVTRKMLVKTIIVERITWLAWVGGMTFGGCCQNGDAAFWLANYRPPFLLNGTGPSDMRWLG
jgi:hypothetical protein